MRLPRWAIALCGAAGLAVAIFLAFKNAHNPAAGIAVGVVGPGWLAVTGILAYWQGGQGNHASTPGETAAAADWLAETVAASWRKEAAARRIMTPAPASVRWRWAHDKITLSRMNEAAPPRLMAGPPPLPDLGGPGQILSSGVVTKLHKELYSRLPHGRLVMTGGPGSGKTGAMILLLLEALDWRRRLPADERRRVPVPVWLTLGGWDPVTVPLSEWVVRVLNQDYPALRSPRYGGDAAAELVAFGWVALFLDGLDEMPGHLRTAALRRLNDEARQLRVVVTSRPREWEEAVGDAGLEHSAVIELRPVRPLTAARFLLQEAPGHDPAAWRGVADYITENPASTAARALATPLALSMARAAYATGDPGVITDPSAFPTVETITTHLMEHFLAVAYPDGHEGDRMTRRLSWIARHMGTSQDLRWWEIPRWVPEWQLRLARAVLGGVTAYLVVTIAALITQGIALMTLFGTVAGLFIAVLTGFVIRPRRKPTYRRWGDRLRGVLTTLIGMTIAVFAALTPILVHYRAEGAADFNSYIIAGVVSTVAGIATFGIFSLMWGRTGPDTAGAPRLLTPRWPRPLWLAPLWVALSPLLLPRLLNLWATPAANSPSATASGTYRADRMTSVVYASTYALTLGVPLGVLLSWTISASGGPGMSLAGPVWGAAGGIVTWVTAWLCTGQVPLVLLTQLILLSRLGRMSFAQLLDDALQRQVLRQAGTVYQFRHAAIQARFQDS